MRWGVGAGAGRTRAPSEDDDATAVIAALARRGEVVLHDELSHSSIVDGCRLSGADVMPTATPTPSTSRGRCASATAARP